jgi:hypothetical protein
MSSLKSQNMDTDSLIEFLDEFRFTLYGVPIMYTVLVTFVHVKALSTTYTLGGGYSEYRC